MNSILYRLSKTKRFTTFQKRRGNIIPLFFLFKSGEQLLGFKAKFFLAEKRYTYQIFFIEKASYGNRYPYKIKIVNHQINKSLAALPYEELGGCAPLIAKIFYWHLATGYDYKLDPLFKGVTIQPSHFALDQSPKALWELAKRYFRMGLPVYELS